MIRISLLAGAAMIAAAFVRPADATVLNAGDILTSFNVVTTGNLRTSADIEGPAVIGGNLSGSATFMNKGLPLGSAFSASYGSVNIYGSAGTATYNANGLNVKVAGAASGANFSGAAAVSYLNSFPNSISDFWTPITTLSSALAGLSSTGQSLPPAGSNNAVLKATPTTVGGVANVGVITISAALLGSYTGISIDLNGATTVIINVTGNFTGGPNMQNAQAWRSNVVWNFVNASNLSFPQGWEGIVLAPNADVTNGNAMEGALAAGSFTGNGELHYIPFSGSTDLLTAYGSSGGPSGGPVNASPTPEPASLVLIATGLLGLAGVRRRRAK
jgi:choice-of-anchor A domain-containing protein